MPFVSVSAQKNKIGDHLSGGIVFRVDNVGRRGLLVCDHAVKDSVTYDDAVKLCDTLTIGGKRGWRLPTGSEWDIFNGQPGILALKAASKLKLDNLYYWEHTGLESSTMASARMVNGPNSVAFYRSKSKLALLVVRQF
jgi:hypothetical protein